MFPKLLDEIIGEWKFETEVFYKEFGELYAELKTTFGFPIFYRT